MLTLLSRFTRCLVVLSAVGLWHSTANAGGQLERLAEFTPLNKNADFVASRLYRIANNDQHFVFNTVCALASQFNPLENCLIYRFSVADNAQDDLSFNLKGKAVIQIVYDEKFAVYAVAGDKLSHQVYQLNESESRWDLVGNLPSGIDVHQLIPAFNALYIQGEQGKTPVVKVLENNEWVTVVDSGTDQPLNVGRLFMWKGNMWSYHPDGQLRNINLRVRNSPSRVPVEGPKDRHQWRWIHGHKHYTFNDTNPNSPYFYDLRVHYPRSGSSCWVCSHDIRGTLYGINIESGDKLETIEDLLLQPKGSAVGSQGITGNWQGWLTNNTVPFFHVGYIADSQYSEGWTWTHGAVRYDDITGKKPKWAWAPFVPDNDANAAIDAMIIDGSGQWLYMAGFEYLGNTTDHPKTRVWRMSIR